MPTTKDVGIPKRYIIAGTIINPPPIPISAARTPTMTPINIGNNIGEDAGQTVMHCHTHLIPRRNKDTPEPRGGVRGVIPKKQKY